MGRSKKVHASAVRPGTPNEAAEAYARLEAEIEAVPDARMQRVSTDVPMAVSLVLGALPEIEGLVPDLSDVFKNPPIDRIERLRDRALALLFAHILWAPRATKLIEEELQEARLLRQQLLSAADAHVKFGQMDARSVEVIRQGSGHLDRANDLIALAALFWANWDAIAARTMVTEEQLERASILGTFLVAELGAKALGTGAAAQRAELGKRRHKAFTLLIEDYNEVRAAIQYLRRKEGDANAFAPSLHRRSRSTSKTEDTATETTGAGARETDAPV